MPTTDNVMWCPTPAAVSAASRLRDAVWKKSSTAASSQAGALATSTTAWAPSTASARPSPVSALTPVSGGAASASGLSPRGFSRSFDPMRPVPPMTTIFIISCLCFRVSGEGEEAVGLREGLGQGMSSEHHAVGAGLDPQGEIGFLQQREPDHPVARPELGHAERCLLRADDAYVDVV